MESIARERESLLRKKKNGNELIDKFLYGYCHYLTQFLSKKHNNNAIIIFYSEETGEAMHSALRIKESDVMKDNREDNDVYILDILGERKASEIVDNYNTIHKETGEYEKCGNCLYESKEVLHNLIETNKNPPYPFGTIVHNTHCGDQFTYLNYRGDGTYIFNYKEIEKEVYKWFKEMK